MAIKSTAPRTITERLHRTRIVPPGGREHTINFFQQILAALQNGLAMTQFGNRECCFASNIPLLAEEGWLRHQKNDAEPPKRRRRARSASATARSHNSGQF